MSISQTRVKLLELPETLGAQGPRAVAVTRHGRPVLALVDWQLYESVLETLEVLGDPGLESALRESLRQLREGRTVPWRKARKRLGM